MDTNAREWKSDLQNTIPKATFHNGSRSLCVLCASVVKLVFYSRRLASIRGFFLKFLL
jgi:hypothetical protein